MNDQASNTKLKQRFSIAMTMPIGGLVLASTLSALYLFTSATAHFVEARQESHAAATTIAAQIAPDLATRDTERLDHVISVLAGGEAAVLSPSGDLIAGDAVIAAEPVHLVPVKLGDATIGELATGRLVTFKLAMPGWGIFLLLIAAIGSAGLITRYWSDGISRSLNGLIDYCERIRSSQRFDLEPRPKVGFTEIARLRAEIERTLAQSERQHKQLQKRAFRDPVTGLPNLTAFTDALETRLAQAEFERPVCLMLLDIDRFDNVCETLGGDVADGMLRAVIDRITNELAALSRDGVIDGSSMMLARLQSDDLALLMPDISGRQEASTVARVLRRAFVAPVTAHGCTVTLGLSGSIVIAPEDGTYPADLLRRANVAMRAMRDEDDSGFRFYTPQLDRVAKGRVQLESEIRTGIENGEFEPYFQPKIDLRTGRIKGCEALARWQREAGRSISPAVFIPVAEETGLIRDIGNQVLEASCRAAGEWLRDGLALSVAVNVSPAQLKDEDYRDHVIAALTRNGLPPHYLELEITESMAIEDPRQFENTIGPLKAMGVRLAIDDFGTGHSNLAILSRLNFDVFKIDRQFILSLQRDDSARPIVEMILAMAESLGLETVAEGVETADQARFLRRRGCTYAQGFLYSPALPGPEFRTFVEAWERRRLLRSGNGQRAAG